MTAVAAWSIWGQNMFPKEGDPIGGMLVPCKILCMLMRFSYRSRDMDQGRVAAVAGSSKISFSSPVPLYENIIYSMFVV